MALIKLTGANGSIWVNPARVNALTGSGKGAKVWFAAGTEDAGDSQSVGDWFHVDIPLDEVAALLNG